MKLSTKFLIGIIVSILVVIGSAISIDCFGQLATTITMLTLGVLSTVVFGALYLAHADF